MWPSLIPSDCKMLEDVLASSAPKSRCMAQPKPKAKPKAGKGPVQLFRIRNIL